MYQPETSSKSLMCLDDMVLLKITNRLHVIDLTNLAKTCRRFAYLIQDHFEKHYSNVRWRKNHRNAITVCESVTIFRNIGKYIRTMDLGTWSDWEFYRILVTIGAECGQLNSLTLDSIRMNGLDNRCRGCAVGGSSANCCNFSVHQDPEVRLMFGRLKQFVLRGCYWSGGCPLKTFFGKNSTLEQLSIIDCRACNGNSNRLQLKEFEALKELRLVECRNLLTFVELQRCFQNNQISSLTMTNEVADINVSLFEPHLINSISNSIETLTFDYHRKFDVHQLMRLTTLKKLRILSHELNNVDELVRRVSPGIEELEMTNVFITKPMLEHFRLFEKLRHLCFEKCYNSIFSELFLILPTILPDLRHLAYTYSVVTDGDIVHMFKLMPKLKYLSLLGCNTLTADTYAEIVNLLIADAQRPKLKFIPPRLDSLQLLISLDNFRRVLC